MVTLEGPSTIRRADESDDFAAGYINFYLCNGAVIAPPFGDKRTDRRSRGILQEQFADREIIQLNIDGIAAGGAFTVLPSSSRASGHVRWAQFVPGSGCYWLELGGRLSEAWRARMIVAYSRILPGAGIGYSSLLFQLINVTPRQ